MSWWSTFTRLGGEARPDDGGRPSPSWVRERRAAFFRDQYGLPPATPTWPEPKVTSKEPTHGETVPEPDHSRPPSPIPSARIVSEPGTSQFSRGGSSACGIAALNSIRELSSIDFGGFTGASLKAGFSLFVLQNRSLTRPLIDHHKALPLLD